MSINNCILTLSLFMWSVLENFSPCCRSIKKLQKSLDYKKNSQFLTWNKLKWPLANHFSTARIFTNVNIWYNDKTSQKSFAKMSPENLPILPASL